MDEQGGVAAIIDQQVWAGAVRPGQHLLCAPPVLLQGLPLPCKDSRGVAGYSCCCVVLHPTKVVTDLTRSRSAPGHAEQPRCGDCRRCCCRVLESACKPDDSLQWPAELPEPLQGWQAGRKAARQVGFQHVRGIRMARGERLSSSTACSAHEICPGDAEERSKLTWVEKMLQEHHLTSAPSAVRVSMSTAV